LQSRGEGQGDAFVAEIFRKGREIADGIDHSHRRLIDIGIAGALGNLYPDDMAARQDIDREGDISAA